MPHDADQAGAYKSNSISGAGLFQMGKLRAFPTRRLVAVELAACRPSAPPRGRGCLLPA